MNAYLMLKEEVLVNTTACEIYDTNIFNLGPIARVKLAFA